MRALFGRKMANLEELRELTEIAQRRGEHDQPYTVIKEVHLGEEAFRNFARDFFNDQPWITKEDGGVNQQGQVRCIRVVNQETGEAILVNNEGYGWPRYTGLESN